MIVFSASFHQIASLSTGSVDLMSAKEYSSDFFKLLHILR